MPKQRRWLILQDFDWCPKPGVVMVFREGQTRMGLTRACIIAAGDRIVEIGV